MTETHIVSAIDKYEIVDYDSSYKSINNTTADYLPIEEEENQFAITNTLLFASGLAVLASVLWISAIVISVVKCRQREPNAGIRQTKMETHHKS